MTHVQTGAAFSMNTRLIGPRIVVRLVLMAGVVLAGWSAFQTLYRNNVQDVRIEAAYAFAAENPGVLEYIPCSCGCGLRLQHTSVERCFIASRSGPDGRDVQYDEHGARCWECVDIVHEVRALLAEGRSLAEIRRTIERIGDVPGGTPLWTETTDVPAGR